MRDSQSTPAGSSGQPTTPQAVQQPDPALRRRQLVRMAMSGAPLMVLLPTAASAQALTSAYRAAQNDAQASPPTVTSATDGWLRVPATRLEPKSGTGDVLFKIGTRYYRDSNGSEVTAGVDENNYNAFSRYALMLFSANYGASPSIDGGVPYPIRTLGQGLHLSAWNSVNPGGGGSYDSVNWVS